MIVISLTIFFIKTKVDTQSRVTIVSKPIPQLVRERVITTTTQRGKPKNFNNFLRGKSFVYQP